MYPLRNPLQTEVSILVYKPRIVRLLGFLSLNITPDSPSRTEPHSLPHILQLKRPPVILVVKYHLCQRHNILVPSACLGTTILGHADIFYALIEEIIVWLAGVGPKH